MPVILTNKSYTDNFGNTDTYYKVNVGDFCTINLEFDTNIRVSTLDTPIYLDPTTNTLTASAFNYLTEGFRDGDTVQFTRYTAGGVPVATWSTTINSLTTTVMDVGAILGWNTSNGNFMVIETNARNRDDLDVYFNQVLNSTAGGVYSLIDGEPSRINFAGLFTLAVTGTVTGVQIPNRSGSAVESATITRLANPSTYSRRYKLTINFNNAGFYDSLWFDSGDCLKNYIKLSWASIDNEPYDRYEYVYNDNADTGYFEDGYNSQISDVSLTAGFTSLDYTIPTNFICQVTASAGYEGLGAAYIPIDSTYYKNRTYTQQELTMLLYTEAVTTSPTTSATNPDGADYELELNTAVTNIGSIYTIDAKFTPSAAFTTFMDGRDQGDRRMIVWAKFGNTNTILFDGEATTAAAGDETLVMVQNIFFDHSENGDTSIDTALTYEADTEDDLAFTGTFRLTDGSLYNTFTASIVARNTTTLEQFALTSAFFNIASIPFVGGKYIINEVLPVLPQLPTTSGKRNALLRLDPSYDIFGEYGVQIYLPFLLRWEYWLDQPNANNDFYPNDQTKNWYPYGQLGDWELQLELRLTADGSPDYVFYDTLTDKDYNDNLGAIVQDIELEIVSTSQVVGVVAIGEIMKVTATHTLVDGTIWDYPNVWGMITVEPYEASQRWISSTVINYDYDANNPLYPLAGETKCKMSLTAPNVVTLECLFDPSKINLDNGVSFTTKIKGCKSLDNTGYKLMTNGQYKLITDNQAKILS